ncbi:Aste57867_9979 [Aphanomyces stellatus]|uniref:Aste57867_9979 protein n=1 Tax=Aphanomyces stellatus TaxID=120398 RepID=A0A485KP74_9STRA|nr:hypothetical protein As57867_009940 [Aphanomyces stellatus]VFT86857.1 Aste57867_9979 [Aphanomyces stellatus]
MARRKREPAARLLDTLDDAAYQDDCVSPGILGDMLSLDDEMAAPSKKTKAVSPRKSHIPIYDKHAAKPALSPRPPQKERKQPPRIDDEEDAANVPWHDDDDDNRSFLNEESVFVPSPPRQKPKSIRLDFPNDVTATPPPTLKSPRAPKTHRTAKHASSPKKHTKGISSEQSMPPASQIVEPEPEMLQDPMSVSPPIQPPATEIVATTAEESRVDSTALSPPVVQDAGDDPPSLDNEIGHEYDEQIALVMMELEALNLLHSQLVDAKAKAKEHFKNLKAVTQLRVEQSSTYVTQAPVDQSTRSSRHNPPADKSVYHPSPHKSPKKTPRKVDVTAPLPPLQAATTAAFPNIVPSQMMQDGGTYPWSKYMLQQMQQQQHLMPHQVHGGATPVVYVPILNPAYMAEVQHQQDQQLQQQSTIDVPAKEDAIAEAVKPPVEKRAAAKKQRVKKAASGKRPLVKKHTARELVFPR